MRFEPPGRKHRAPSHRLVYVQTVECANVPVVVFSQQRFLEQIIASAFIKEILDDNQTQRAQEMATYGVKIIGHRVNVPYNDREQLALLSRGR